MINILKHRARTVCSNQQLLKKEEDHLNKALKNYRYSVWHLNRANIRRKNNNKNKKNNRSSNDNKKNKPSIVVPYMKGLSESCKNNWRKHGIEMNFKGSNTIKDLLVYPKDRYDILQKSGVIYRYKCGREDCEDEYIGESGRTFAERFRDNFSIVGREDQSLARTIREAMLIKVNDPSLNRNIGKYQLPHIWDEVLVKSPELKLK